jgi:hypothetical protein
MEVLEEQIARWRAYLARRQAIHSVDVAELEDHLRERIASLIDAGLAPDEAFLVAVKRMGELDALSREFAREHSERLWKQLVISSADIGGDEPAARKDAIVAFGLAAVAALLFKLPALFGFGLEEGNETAYARNYSFFVLPLLVGYFTWKRGLPDAGEQALRRTTLAWIAAGFAAALVFANVYPFRTGGNTEVLTVIHLPIALWLLVGIAYAGARWSEVSGRMDFIRFSGELFIYFVLLALGGGLVMASTFGIFGLIGIDPEPYVETWLPAGPLAGVIVASWLVEAKQSVVENIAPVLTRLFSPLFAAVLLAFLGALVVTGRGIAIEREALILFDLLLLLVLCLLLYSLSARDPQAHAGPFDVVQIVLVVSALLADAVALSAIAARITEFGFTPNRVAALGMNVILLVNLAWSAVLYLRFLRGRGSFAAIERWQTNYLPVYAGWAALVVIVFPPLFGFI